MFDLSHRWTRISPSRECNCRSFESWILFSVVLDAKVLRQMSQHVASSTFRSIPTAVRFQWNWFLFRKLQASRNRIWFLQITEKKKLLRWLKCECVATTDTSAHCECGSCGRCKYCKVKPTKCYKVSAKFIYSRATSGVKLSCYLRWRRDAKFGSNNVASASQFMNN